MTYGIEVRNKFLELVYAGKKYNEISKLLNVSHVTLTEWTGLYFQIIEQQVLLTPESFKNIKKPRGCVIRVKSGYFPNKKDT